MNREIISRDKLVEEQIASLRETGQILIEKEQIYKNLLYEYKMDSLELAMKIQSKNIELKSQQNIRLLLEESISEKKTEIQQTNNELKIIREGSEKSRMEISMLKDTIAGLQVKITGLTKDLIRSMELNEVSKKEVSRLEKELDDCINKDKRKTVRMVQGVAIKTFRTPEYELAPKDVNNANVYVINNKNSGNLEIDYITGASIRILDISKPGNKYPSDLGLFVGLGGTDLLKNFYIAPNLCLFSVIHINTGINFHEMEVLKTGFNEGDPLAVGTIIPTNKQWKLNGYFGLTFDLSVASGIFKKK